MSLINVELDIRTDEHSWNGEKEHSGDCEGLSGHYVKVYTLPFIPSPGDILHFDEGGEEIDVKVGSPSRTWNHAKNTLEIYVLYGFSYGMEYYDLNKDIIAKLQRMGWKKFS